MDSLSAITRVLVIGFGNPGRLDDGLGPALAECVAGLGLANVSTEAFYQLSVEDSLELALCDVVVFADATVDKQRPFALSVIEPDANASFTTHSVSPGAVLSLAGSVHGACPDAYLLTIRGHEFDAFGEVLSEPAKQDLQAAFEFLAPLLEARDPNLFREAAAEPDSSQPTCSHG